MARRVYEAVTDAAEALRPSLPDTPVVGLIVPPGFETGTLGLVQGTAWKPFIAAGEIGTRTAIRLPDAAQGIDPDRIFAIRVLRALGGTVLITIDLCTALRPRFHVGSLVAVADHLNLTGTSPLVGPNDERIGPRFPSMAEPYDSRLLDHVERIAVDERVAMQRGVYAGLAGPDLPTPAECRFLAYVGADVYGFGTVPDTLTAVHAGLQVLALAVVMACRLPDGPETGDPTRAALLADVAPGLVRLLTRVIEEL